MNSTAEILEGLLKQVNELKADKRRIDYLFSDQTDLIIVDHGTIGPEPGIVISRECLDKIIEDRS